MAAKAVGIEKIAGNPIKFKNVEGEIAKFYKITDNTVRTKKVLEKPLNQIK